MPTFGANEVIDLSIKVQEAAHTLSYPQSATNGCAFTDFDVNNNGLTFLDYTPPSPGDASVSIDVQTDDPSDIGTYFFQIREKQRDDPSVFKAYTINIEIQPSTFCTPVFSAPQTIEFDIEVN